MGAEPQKHKLKLKVKFQVESTVNPFITIKLYQTFFIKLLYQTVSNFFYHNQNLKPGGAFNARVSLHCCPHHVEREPIPEQDEDEPKDDLTRVMPAPPQRAHERVLRTV